MLMLYHAAQAGDDGLREFDALLCALLLHGEICFAAAAYGGVFPWLAEGPGHGCEEVYLAGEGAGGWHAAADHDAVDGGEEGGGGTLS